MLPGRAFNSYWWAHEAGCRRIISGIHIHYGVGFAPAPFAYGKEREFLHDARETFWPPVASIVPY